MPLDNANYISELNIANPNGAVDTVDMLDDFLREIKKALIQSLPNINKQTNITSDALNDLADNLKFGNGTWNVQDKAVLGVKAADDDTAVEPRLYNDGRYARLSNNLSDLADNNAALGNLFGNIDNTTPGVKAMILSVAANIYPVGTVYTNGRVSTNPYDLFGVGTWAQFSPGRVLIGHGSTTDSRGEGRNFTNGQQGGEYQHQLSVHEMPSHGHTIGLGNNANVYGDKPGGSNSARVTNGGTDNTGGNGAHNNVQPYLVAYMWVRTA